LNRDRKRICLFPGHLQMSGVIRTTINLAEAFLQRGMAVDLFLTRAGGQYWDQLPAGVGVHVGSGSKKRSFPALIRYLRRARPAGLIAAHPGVNVMSILARRFAAVPTRVIATIHNDTSVRPATDRRLRSMGLTRVMRMTYPHADSIVAVSAGVADDAARATGLPRDRIDVIYNPIVTPALLRSATDPIDHPWFEPAEPPVILAAGRLTRQKDLTTLVRAFALVRVEVAARLLILGEGEDRPLLENLVRDLGMGEHVALPGAVDNAMPYMARASVLALSSAWEGLPTVLVEAMAVGTPVVATDCPSGPAEILDNGRFGELVPVGDAEALAAAIVHTLRAPPPREVLVERARDFSADAAADRYLELVFDGRTDT
jgi:glycosyltransferase involved in cell wall biosynthesis